MAKTTVPSQYIADNAVTTAKIAANAITAAQIAGGAIVSVDLGDNSITVASIAGNAVGSSEIAANAVGNSQIAANAVDSAEIVGGSIDTVHLSADAVNGTKIADDSIDSEHYVDGSIDTAHIGDSQVTNAKLANSSVTVNSNSLSLGGTLTLDTDDIGEGSTNLYFTNVRAQSAISAGTGITVSSGEISIAGNAITATMIAKNAVGSSEIAADSVGSSEIAANAVSTSELASTAAPTFASITTTGNGDIGGNLTVTGNLQVDGTTTTINSTNLSIDDKLITVAAGAANAAAADGAGIEVDITGATNPSILYDGTNDEWDFNKNVNVTGTINSGAITSTGDLELSKNDPVITLNDSGASSSITGQSGNILYKTSSTNRDHIFYGVNNEKFRITGDGLLQVGSSQTTILDASRNLTNIGTIFSGAITIGSSTVATPNAAADDFVIKGSGTAVGMTIAQDSASGTGTIFFGDTTSNSAGGFRYNHNTGDMAIQAEDFVNFNADGLQISGTTFLDSSRNIINANAIGIGTASVTSGYLLHLKSTGDAAILLEADTDNVTETDNPRIQFSQDGGLVQGRIGYTNGANSFEIINEYNDALILGQNNLARLTLTSTSATFTGTITSGAIQIGDSLGSGYGITVDPNTQYGAIVQTTESTPTPNPNLWCRIDDDGVVSTLFRVQNNGLVGIGTSSPVQPLHIHTSSNSQMQFTDNASGSASSDGLRVGWNGTVGQAWLFENADYRIATNNTEAMRILSTGVVGIGYNGATITGGGILSVNGRGVFRNDGAGYVQGSILLSSGTNDTPSYRGQGIYTYNEGHDVSWYIGTPYTNGDLFTINRQHSTTSFDGAAADTSGTNVNNFFSIRNSGEVGVGILSPTSPFHVNATYAGYVSDFVQGGSGGGNHGLRVVSGSASSYTAIFRANAATVFYVDGSGNYYFSGSNQSDLNKKENIADLTDNALDLITQLQPKTYNFIGNDIDKAGFIAQEMEQVIPRLVSGNEFDPDATDEDGNNPTGKGIDYMGYTAYLTKAIQELKEELDAAKARITELEQ